MSDRTVTPGGTPTAVSALLLDDATLAAHARTTLAAADVATVVGPAGVRVVIRDRDGEPELRDLPADLVESVGRGRRTTVVVTPRLDDGVWLVLDGRLVGRDHTVVLAVEAVWVGCPQGHGHARPLDLDAYATAAPDAVRAAVPRLLEHTNAGHGVELRTLAARHLAIGAGDVVAAQLCDLGAAGVTLRAITVDGAVDVRLRFARPATTPCELLGMLRGVLTGS